MRTLFIFFSIKTRKKKKKLERLERRLCDPLQTGPRRGRRVERWAPASDHREAPPRLAKLSSEPLAADTLSNRGILAYAHATSSGGGFVGMSREIPSSPHLNKATKGDAADKHCPVLGTVGWQAPDQRFVEQPEKRRCEYGGCYRRQLKVQAVEAWGSSCVLRSDSS
ncbi:hypothetical protein IE53DRAFT_246140 [Violaceomyces palustris]|uniref:Uncharacterized protein n=1 Tax=Violaceomyces palustris TaxID=1673888 RepID=A0ACD0NNX2_9BASI|nr:hypothetical protein IE53DRAFT_246140 [Violaceomyces palustris]